MKINLLATILLCSHLLCSHLLCSTVAAKPPRLQAKPEATPMSSLTNQLIAVGATALVTGVGYIGYALYLNNRLNQKQALWRWASEQLQSGRIDELALLAYAQDRYPTYYSTHPLMALFALLHALEDELAACFSLQGAVRTFTFLKLGWLAPETIIALDKKIESLYLLKFALEQSVQETRSRTKRNALA